MLFPKLDRFDLAGHTLSADQVWEILALGITPERLAKIDQVTWGRTYSIVAVCDDLYDHGNLAAVMRSAEAMGIQELHRVHLGTKMKRSQRSITMGTDKWLDLHTWTDRTQCIQALKARGYRIVATHLSPDAVPISQIDFTHPTALILGNEKVGVSPDFLAASDARVILPMTGFAESFNISVAAALCFYHITQDRHRRQGFHGDLTPHQRHILRADFALRALAHPDRLISAYIARHLDLPPPPKPHEES